MQEFYKPTPKVSGFACNWELTSTGDSAGVYLNFRKQTAWDTTKKVGSFKNGAQAKIKFNKIEVGKLIDAMNRDVECKLFHSSAAGTSGITFKPYSRGDTRIGYSLSVTNKKKGESSSQMFGMWFDFGEAELLKNFFGNCLDRFFQAAYSDKKKRFKESQQSGS